MKRIPMSHTARLQAAERQRKWARRVKLAVIVFAAVTAGVWAYAFLQA